MNTIALHYTIFKNEKKCMLTLINVGTENNNQITIETKNGIITKDKSAFDNSILFSDLSQIDFKDSLHHWFRRRENLHHTSKDVVLNESLTIGQEYFGNGWAYGLLINPKEEVIEVKIIKN